MKIILDAMLGHLLSWFRILGYDTTYWPSGENDDSLIKEASSSNRVIITRDNLLFQKASRQGMRCVYLPTYDTVEALAYLVKALGIEVRFDEDETRCPECNEKLTKISVNPKRWRCGGCGKEYWIGGHWRNISRILEEVRRRVEQA